MYTKYRKKLKTNINTAYHSRYNKLIKWTVPCWESCSIRNCWAWGREETELAMGCKRPVGRGCKRVYDSKKETLCQ